jgi:hypothetical protein
MEQTVEVSYVGKGKAEQAAHLLQPQGPEEQGK